MKFQIKGGQKHNPTHKCSWIVEIYFGTIKPRDPESVIPVPQPAGLLAHSSNVSRRLPDCSVTFWRHTPAYSDEIAQAFHLFPYSPHFQQHRLLFIQFSMLPRVHYSTLFPIHQPFSGNLRKSGRRKGTDAFFQPSVSSCRL